MEGKEAAAPKKSLATVGKIKITVYKQKPKNPFVASILKNSRQSRPQHVASPRVVKLEETIASVTAKIANASAELANSNTKVTNTRVRVIKLKKTLASVTSKIANATISNSITSTVTNSRVRNIKLKKKLASVNSKIAES